MRKIQGGMMGFVLLWMIYGGIGQALTPDKQKQLENFPVTMTFKAFRGIKPGSKAFKTELQKAKPFNWIHAPAPKLIKEIRKAYPHKIITMQDAWGGTMGEMKRYRSWPGYWLYRPYTIVRSDLNSTGMELLVDDAKLLVKNNRYLQKRNRRVKLGVAAVIYALDKNGKPDFDHAEQVGLVSVHGNHVRIRRSLVGGKPLSFLAGHAAIATHIYYWTNQWQLNMSLDAPINPHNGLTAAKWYAHVIAERLQKYPVDGVEFDVARWIFGHAKSHPIDCNNDGRIDYGFIQGINSFGLGGQVFLKELRKLLGPDAIIQMDSNNALTGQRGWNYVNGIQMESFPMDNHFDRLSEAFLHLRLWTANAKASPHISYAFSKTSTSTYAQSYLPDGRSTDFRFRVGLAADVLLGMPHPFLSLSKNHFDPENPAEKPGRIKKIAGIFIWDEYLGGKLKKPGWLGRPVGPVKRHDDRLDERNNLLDLKKARWFSSKRYTIRAKSFGNLFEVDVTDIREPIMPQRRYFGARLHIPLKTPILPGEEYTLVFDVSGDDAWRHHDITLYNVPRAIAIRGIFGYPKKKPASVLVDSKWRRVQFSFTPRSSVNGKFLEIGCGEQLGKTRLKNIRLYSGAIGAHWSREFEHGLVLLNTSNHPWKYHLPNSERYRRLDGRQNPQINNGTAVGPTVTIPGKDALYLLREPYKATH